MKAGLDVLGIKKADFVAYSMGGLEMVRSLMPIVNFAKNHKNSKDSIAKSGTNAKPYVDAPICQAISGHATNAQYAAGDGR